MTEPLEVGPNDVLIALFAMTLVATAIVRRFRRRAAREAQP
jgi:hypothetical protein